MPWRHHSNAKVYETKKPEKSKRIFTDGTWTDSCNKVLFANWLKAAFNTMFGFTDELQKIFLSFVSQSQCLRKQKQIHVAVRCEEGFNNMQKEKEKCALYLPSDSSDSGTSSSSPEIKWEQMGQTLHNGEKLAFWGTRAQVEHSKLKTRPLQPRPKLGYWRKVYHLFCTCRYTKTNMAA